MSHSKKLRGSSFAVQRAAIDRAKTARKLAKSDAAAGGHYRRLELLYGHGSEPDRQSLPTRETAHSEE